MYKFKFIVFLLFSLVCSNYSTAQTIMGKVAENDSTPIPYVTVSLLQANDSSFISGTVTNKEGAFTFHDSPEGKLVRLSYVGYKTQIIPAAGHMNVILPTAEQTLKEVTITSTPPTFKMVHGVFQANIQGTAYSQLGKAVDVLQQLPLMSFDGLRVLGRGTPLIYINNKPMRNKGELDRITSDMIKDIKIDMNPGAKYSSDVRAVLFITTIKPVGEGLGGSVTMKESASSCWDTEGWLNLNYRKKGLDFFVNSYFDTYNNSHYTRKDTYDFQYKGQNIYANYAGDGYQSMKNGYVSVGINNQFSQKQSLGLTYTFSRTFDNNARQDYHNDVQSGSNLTEFDTNSQKSSQNGSHTVSFYYENKFSDKLLLNVDGTYVHNNMNNRQVIVDTQVNDSALLMPVAKTKADMGALKTVFTSSVKDMRLEYGFETTYTRFSQNYDAEDNDYTNVLKHNDNESKQAAASVFVNYSQSFGKCFTQLGLRYEYANYDYYTGGKRVDESSRSYHHILPSASFSFDLKGLALMLSYNIYMSKPSYTQLDEGLQYISNFRYYKGNSLLKPTYNHQVSFNASYKDLQFMGLYTYGKDAVISLFNVMDEIPAVLASYKNHSYSSSYVSVSYSPTFFKIWRPSWNIWCFKQWLTYDGLSYDHPQLGLVWKNLIILPKKWYLMLNTSGNLKGNADTYMSKPSLNVNIALQKSIKNWWFKLSAIDVFNAKEKGYAQYAKAYTSHYVDYKHSIISLTVSYSFNPATSKYKGKGAGNSEKNRL